LTRNAPWTIKILIGKVGDRETAANWKLGVWASRAWSCYKKLEHLYEKNINTSVFVEYIKQIWVVLETIDHQSKIIILSTYDESWKRRLRFGSLMCQPLLNNFWGAFENPHDFLILLIRLESLPIFVGFLTPVTSFSLICNSLAFWLNLNLAQIIITSGDAFVVPSTGLSLFQARGSPVSWIH